LRPRWVLGRTRPPASPVGIQWFRTIGFRTIGFRTIGFRTIGFRNRWWVRQPRSTRFQFEVELFGACLVGLSGRATSYRVGIAYRVSLALFECRLRRQWQRRFQLQPCGR
jgi:hypothetical protein